MDLMPQFSMSWLSPDHRAIQGPNTQPQRPSTPEARKSRSNSFLGPFQRISRGSSPAPKSYQTSPSLSPVVLRTDNLFLEPISDLKIHHHLKSRPKAFSNPGSGHNSNIAGINPSKQVRDKLLCPEKQRRAQNKREARLQSQCRTNTHGEWSAEEADRMDPQQSPKRSRVQGLRVTTEFQQTHVTSVRPNSSLSLLKPSATSQTAKTLPSVSSITVGDSRDISSELESLRLGVNSHTEPCSVPRDSSRFVIDSHHLSTDTAGSPCLSEAERSFIATPDTDDFEDLCARELDPTWMAIKSTVVRLLLEEWIASRPNRENKIVSCASPKAADPSQRPSNANNKEQKAPSRDRQPIKRSREDDEHQDDEDDDLKEKKPKLEKFAAHRTDNKILACPYCKWNPYRFSQHNNEEKDYRGCSSVYLTEISRLKQHLYRVHSKPRWYCPVCWIAFKENQKTQYEQHIRDRVCQSTGDDPWTEKMTEDQFRAVKRRRLGNNEEENWYAIWEILFPDCGRPASIYADDLPIYLPEVLDFFNRYVPGILIEAWHQQVPPFPLEEHISAIRDDTLPDFVQNAVGMMRLGFTEIMANRPNPNGSVIERTTSSLAGSHLPAPKPGPKPLASSHLRLHLSPNMPRGHGHPSSEQNPSRTGGRQGLMDQQSQTETPSPSTGVLISPSLSPFPQLASDGSSISERWEADNLMEHLTFPQDIAHLPTQAAHNALQDVTRQLLDSNVRQDYQQIGVWDQAAYHQQSLPNVALNGTVNPAMLQRPRINITPEHNHPHQASTGMNRSQPTQGGGTQRSYPYYGAAI